MYPPKVTKTSKKMMTSSSSKMLAGYMAYEFLTKGSVLGRKVDKKAKVANENESCYKEITSLMMSNGGDSNNGVCISGVVNPTQLAKWINM